MTAYFSFRKLITPYFVRVIYTIGFAALTAAGIGWAVWAGMRLKAATLPTRLAVYYIAIGVGTLLVGNLAWRMICEFWLLLFNMHGLLAAIEKELKHESIQHQPSMEAIEEEARPTGVLTERRTVSVAPSGSVLGLSS
jgi:hypothetical protein